MHSVALGKSVLSDARFGRLLDATGWGRAQAVGVLVLLWWHTRDRAVGRTPSRETVLGVLPFPRELSDAALKALADSGYVVDDGVACTIVDNAAYFDASDKMSEAGKRGGYPKHKPVTAKKPRAKRAKSAPSTSTETWAAYRQAFVERYGAEPVRNERVNSQLAHLVHRIGKDDSVALARFYVQHDSSYYLRKQHAVSDLVHNCEQLVVQMRQGRPLNDHEVRAQGDAGRMAAQLHRLGVG